VEILQRPGPRNSKEYLLPKSDVDAVFLELHRDHPQPPPGSWTDGQ